MALVKVIFSAGARGTNRPRTISSSARRAQSSASFLRRKVLMVWKPIFRIMAFQVPEGVLTMVGMSRYGVAEPWHCTEIVPAVKFVPRQSKKDLAISR
jgi:hypothetical protein